MNTYELIDDDIFTLSEEFNYETRMTKEELDWLDAACPEDYDFDIETSRELDAIDAAMRKWGDL